MPQMFALCLHTAGNVASGLEAIMLGAGAVGWDSMAGL